MSTIPKHTVVDGKDLKAYSVLLLYPDYISDPADRETWYGFTEAESPDEAVRKVQADAANAQTEYADDDNVADDFAPLLVTLGHNFGQPFHD